MSIENWLFVISWYGGWMLIFTVAILTALRVGRYLLDRLTASTVPDAYSARSKDRDGYLDRFLEGPPN